MPRIVPLQLLKCLRVLLDTNGGILSATEVKRIAGLMTKYSKKLVSKCVYVQILKSTKTELLGDFMAVGGWPLVCTWLSDAIRTMNWPLVQEILELLLLSPVDINRLKINSAPALVKGLCKDGGNEGVRILAKRLVEQWLKIVTENPNPAQTVGLSCGTFESQQSVPEVDQKDAHMEHSSSDSTDSGGGSVKQNYTITSAERKRNIVITIKTVDKSATKLTTPDSVYNDDDSSLPPSEAGSESKGTESNANLESSEKTNLDSSTTDSKLDDDAEKKHKSSRDKNRRSEKDRDKDRKSSSSHRSSSSSHKSSSSSSSTSKSSSRSSSSSSHRSSSDKHRDKDKSRSSSSSSSSKDKDRKEGSSSSSSSSTTSSSKHKSSKPSSSSSSSTSSSSTSKDRSRDKDKEKASQSTSPAVKKENEKDNKLMPPPTASTAEKKSKEGDGDAQKPKSISIPNRKASISIEIRRDTEKTATVKTYQSKFRSHGLTEEAPPPPSRKGLKKPVSTATATAPLTLPSATVLKRPSPPPRDVPSEKKPKIDINNLSGHVDRPGAVKLIAPKKISTLVETNIFSDALTASIEPKKVVKRKRTNTMASPTEKEAPLAPLKFYQDTLDEPKSEDKSDDSTKENDESRTASPGKDTDGDDDDIPLKKVKEEIEQKVQMQRSTGEDGDGSSGDGDNVTEEPKKPGPGCGPNGPPGVLMLHRRRGPKKKLTWQPDEKLTQIRYFEVDLSERVNVTKQSFLEMKNMERYSERDAINIARRGFDDIMEPQMEWRPLIEVANVPDHPNGNLSKQRIVQAEREASTLRALYFSPDMIPDSAAEAELEPHFSHNIPIIPIDDLTGNPDAVNDYSSLPWPEPKGYSAASHELGYSDNISNIINSAINSNMLPPVSSNHFQPFSNNFMTGTGNIPANPNAPMSMNMPQPGPPPIWQNQMNNSSPMLNAMNGPTVGMDMNTPPGIPPNFIGNQFGSPNAPFGGSPGGFNNLNYPPIMMNGPGGPGPNGPMLNGAMPNGMGPMQNGGGPRNNNNMNRKNNVGGGGGVGVGGGGGGNWRIGGNNFQDNSGGNWRSAGSGTNRGGGNSNNNNVGGGGNNNSGICKQFMRGHCHMGKSCKYVHPQKKRL